MLRFFVFVPKKSLRLKFNNMDNFIEIYFHSHPTSETNKMNELLGTNEPIIGKLEITKPIPMDSKFITEWKKIADSMVSLVSVIQNLQTPLKFLIYSVGGSCILISTVYSFRLLFPTNSYREGKKEEK